MKLHNNKLFFLIIGAGLFLSSCTKDFEEVNTNPTSPEVVPIGYLFTNAIAAGPGSEYEIRRANLRFCATVVQHLASPLATLWDGDKYQYYEEQSSALFGSTYTSPLKAIEDVLDKAAKEEDNANYVACAKIWKVLVMHKVTDLYGDVPYSEAGKGYLEQIFLPKYDAQKDIYDKMLTELDEAAAALDATKPGYGNADVIYQGDVAKWKKLANSLMLRLGFRLIKVDAAKAEQWVKKAIAGGVMQSNADLCYTKHDAINYLNPNGYAFIRRNEIANQEVKLSLTFVNFMKSKGDPRLGIYGNLHKDVAGNVDNTPANQKGLPNGWDNSSGTAYPSLESYSGGANLLTYTEPGINIIREDAPFFFITYAESELLQAEAAVRGWTTDDAASHYNKGVEAAMKALALYPNKPTISDAQITTYLTANPLPAGSDEQKLEAINTQYWAAVFLNEYEAFANWRRTGYPVLTPVNYPGNVTGGKIPRRLKYPQSEYGINKVNVDAAVSRQGADEMITPVWWDKQ